MVSIKFVSLVVFAVWATAACKKTSDNANETSTEATEDVADTEELPVLAGTVAITTGDKALKFVQAALASTAEVSTEMSAITAGTIAISLTSDDDPNCYYGDPRNDNESIYIMPGDNARVGAVNERAPYYASGLWYCHLKHVIPSAFDTPAAVTCAVGDIPYDGSVVDQEMTIDTTNKECFGDDPGEGQSMLSAKVTATSLNEAEYGFDRQLKIVIGDDSNSEAPQEFNIRFKITDKSIAFATWEMRDARKFGLAARLDTEEGIARFVELDDSLTSGVDDPDDNETRVRSTRMFVKGIFKDGKFSSISQMDGAKADLFFRKGEDGYTTRFVSMSGNVDNGVKTKNYGAPLGDTVVGTILPLNQIPDLDNYDWPDGVNGGGVLRDQPLSGCFGKTGVACAGNSGITLTEANLHKVFLFPKSKFPSSSVSIDPMEWAQTKAAFLTFSNSELLDSVAP